MRLRRKTLQERLWDAVRHDLGEKWFGLVPRDLVVTNIMWDGARVTVELETRESLEKRNTVVNIYNQGTYKEGVSE